MKKKPKTFKNLKMKTIFKILLVVSICFSCKEQSKQTANPESVNDVKKNIGIVLNKWHKAAADANFEAYFDLMTTDAIFIGTDATENWDYSSFKEFSRPYFDKGKAWNSSLCTLYSSSK